MSLLQGFPVQGAPGYGAGARYFARIRGSRRIDRSSIDGSRRAWQ